LRLRSVRFRTISKPSDLFSAQSWYTTTRSTSRAGHRQRRLLSRRASPHLRLAWWRSTSDTTRIDFVTLKEELARSGQLDDVGGPSYIASLADGVPRATNVEYYARIVKEKSTLRNLIYAANKILSNAYEAEQESDLILDDAESSIFAWPIDRLKGRLRADARSGQGELSEDRAALRTEAPGHRCPDRVRRSR
jgi:hypothetical protein